MVDLRPDQLAIVQAVLKAEVPKTEVWAFGSRASWRARDTSDLDLVLVGERALSYRTIARLRRAFEESYLPFSVDVMDWHAVSEDFRAIILAQKVVIQAGSPDGSGQLEERQWRSVPLAECANFLSGGTPPKGVPDYWNGGIPWVSAKDMKTFRLSDTLEHVTPEGVAHGTRLVPAGTVLVLVRGMTLHSDVPVCITRRPMAFNQDVRALRPRPEVDSDYLAYALLANKPALLSMVDSASHGTGRIHSGALASFPMAVPSLSEQRTITHVLGTLDDRIDLNNRMNQTLGAMARAIFKSWFVDFEPVQKGSLLFPQTLRTSDLGPIPEGWKVEKLGACCDFAYGKALKGEHRSEGNIPVFGSNGRIGWHDQALVKGPGIVVGRKGNPGTVIWASADFFPIDTTFYVIPRKADISIHYLFFTLSSLNLPSLSTDSAVPGLSRNMAYLSDILLPPGVVTKAFAATIRPFMDKAALNDQETATLAALRDTLLPKLLSGEIRVKQAEKIVSEAV